MFIKSRQICQHKYIVQAVLQERAICDMRFINVKVDYAALS